MTANAAGVLRDALALSAQDRADIAAELLASLDEIPADLAEVQAAWAVEIERRARRVMDGSSPGEPWDAVREQIRDRLASQ
jgi:putative addiction module component (TIGR02574 family)